MVAKYYWSIAVFASCIWTTVWGCSGNRMDSANATDRQPRRPCLVTERKDGEVVSTIHYLYDSNGNVTREWQGDDYQCSDEDTAWKRKEYIYSNEGQLLEENHYFACVEAVMRITYEYNAMGKRISVKSYINDEHELTEIFLYDKHGRKTEYWIDNGNGRILAGRYKYTKERDERNFREELIKNGEVGGYIVVEYAEGIETRTQKSSSDKLLTELKTRFNDEGQPISVRADDNGDGIADRIERIGYSKSGKEIHIAKYSNSGGEEVLFEEVNKRYNRLGDIEIEIIETKGKERTEIIYEYECNSGGVNSQ